jgi:hypothetical protein
MTTKQFSKKILGNKMDTRVMLHRISIKFYENGAVIKPIGKQGIAICEALEPQKENQSQQSNNLIRKRLESAPVRVGEIRDGSLRPVSADTQLQKYKK